MTWPVSLPGTFIVLPCLWSSQARCSKVLSSSKSGEPRENQPLVDISRENLGREIGRAKDPSWAHDLGGSPSEALSLRELEGIVQRGAYPDTDRLAPSPVLQFPGV